MDPIQRPWRDRWKIRLLSRLAYMVFAGINKSVRLELRGGEGVMELSKEGPIIAGLFHGQHFVPGYVGRWFHLCVLTSESRDGEILSRILERAGLKTVRGSSSRGGARGIVRLMQAMEEGWNPVLAVDGPRGPRHVVKSGIVLLAQKTGRPIIPVTADAERRFVIRKSWDRYMIPKPFSRALIICGEAFYVAPEDDIESKRAELERVMGEQSRETQAVFGHTDPE